MERIDDKINEIVSFLNELSIIIPPTLEQYETQFEKRAACERYIEKIVEAAEDLAFLIIKAKKISPPEEGREVFPALASAGIISDILAARLRDAKGLRNRLSHQYGKIDNEIVFEVVSQKLEADIRQFIVDIKKVKL